jgi:hypothetical protein
MFDLGLKVDGLKAFLRIAAAALLACSPPRSCLPI